jgi:hypothetical protein
MSGFKKSALEISILANPVTPTDANNITLQSNSNNKLVIRNFSSLSEVIAYESTIAAISAGLQSQITNITGSGTSNHNALTSLQGGISNEYYHLNVGQYNDYIGKTEVTAISSGLANRIGNVEANYTLNSTTTLISSGLNTRINNINILAGSNITVNKTFDNVYTISSVGGGGGSGFTPIAGNGMTITAPTSSSYQFDVTDYISKTEVSGISSGLQTQITALASTTTAISSHISTNLNKSSILLRTQVATGVIPTGQAKIFLICYKAFTITGWRLVSDVATNATVDVWAKNGAIPMNSDSITAAAKPTLASATVNSSSILTSWITTLIAGDILELEVEANSSASVLNLTLEVNLG